MVKENIDVIIRLQVTSPLKNTFKKVVLDDLTSFCALKGAENITVIETSYIMGEMPNRNRLFQISLNLKCRVKDIVKICDAVSNLYFELNNVVSVTVRREGSWRGTFVKDGPERGVLKPIDDSHEYPPSTIIEAEYIEYE